MWKGSESKISFRYPTQECENFPSDFLLARWRNLRCVECLQMIIKPLVVGFCWVDVTLVVKFENTCIVPRLFQDFMDGYIKPLDSPISG